LVSKQGDFLMLYVVVEGKQRRQIVYKGRDHRLEG
jgi:hypothetical protein